MERCQISVTAIFLSLFIPFQVISLDLFASCGDTTIVVFSERKDFGFGHAKEIEQQIRNELADKKRLVEDIRRIVTHEEKAAESLVLSSDTRSIRGQQLDVLTSKETTEVVIEFHNGPILRMLITYPRPKRGPVFG